MKLFFDRFKTVCLFLPLLALLCPACLSSRWVLTEVQEDQGAKVYLEHRVEDDLIVDPDYAHPYALDPRELAEVFYRFHYQKPRLFKDPLIEPVFYKGEADHLAGAVALALASAQPWQRVRFASYNRGGGLLFSVQRKTEGVIFMEEGNRLSVAFNTVNKEADPTELHDPEMDITRKDPLGIQTSHAPLNPHAWYELKYDEAMEKNRPLWAVVDLNKVREAYASAGRPEAAHEIRTPAQPETTAERVEEKPEEVAPAASSESTPPGQTGSQPSEHAITDPVLEALKLLKKIYEEGLIDEEEYKAKKKEILEKIE